MHNSKAVALPFPFFYGVISMEAKRVKSVKCPKCGHGKFKRVTVDAVTIDDDGETLTDADDDITRHDFDGYSVDYFCLKCGAKVEPTAVTGKSHST